MQEAASSLAGCGTQSLIRREQIVNSVLLHEASTQLQPVSGSASQFVALLTEAQRRVACECQTQLTNAYSLQGQ